MSRKPKWPFQVPDVGDVVSIFWRDASFRVNEERDDDGLVDMVTTGQVRSVKDDCIVTCTDFHPDEDDARRISATPLTCISRVHVWGNLDQVNRRRVMRA